VENFQNNLLVRAYGWDRIYFLLIMKSICSNHYSLSFFNFWACLTTSDLGIGCASFSSFSQSFSRSWFKKGFLKGVGDACFLVFPIYKYTKKYGKKLCNICPYPSQSFFTNSSGVGIRASRVIHLPSWSIVTAIFSPLHLLVKPVKIYTGKSKSDSFTSQTDKPSITSSSSLVDRIPASWSTGILIWEWSYVIFSCIESDFKRNKSQVALAQVHLWYDYSSPKRE